MSMTRRSFLQASLGLAVNGVIPQVFASTTRYTLFGAWKNRHVFGAGVLNSHLDLSHHSVLPTRAHHIEVINDTEAWLFARRPSSYMQRVNWHTGQLLTQYIYDHNRTGFGHGIMTNHGELLTTDQRLDDDAGLLTVRNGRTGEVQREFLSGGIGPHELLLLPDGIHIAIANGGILTRPDTGRTQLNLADMRPNLSIVNHQTGQIVQQAQLDQMNLSIRHLARVSDQTIGVALQNEQSAQKPRPFAALWRSDKGLHILEAPNDLLLQAQGYAASAASDASSYFAVSCPKAGVVAIWNQQGQWLKALKIPLAYGLAPMPHMHCLAVSSENGSIYYYDTQTWQEKHAQRQSFNVQWDNHLIAWKNN